MDSTARMSGGIYVSQQPTQQRIVTQSVTYNADL